MRVIHMTDGRIQGSREISAEREARRQAAEWLGCRSLRGLAQAPTETGTLYYAPGASDTDGDSVEIQY